MSSARILFGWRCWAGCWSYRLENILSKYLYRIWLMWVASSQILLEIGLGWHTVQGLFWIPDCWIFNAAALMSSKPRYSAGGLGAGLFSLLLLMESLGGAISCTSGASITLVLKALTSPFKYSSAPKSRRRSGQMRVGLRERSPLLMMVSFWHRPSWDEHVFILLLKCWSSLIKKDIDLC